MPINRKNATDLYEVDYLGRRVWWMPGDKSRGWSTDEPVGDGDAAAVRSLFISMTFYALLVLVAAALPRLMLTDTPMRDEYSAFWAKADNGDCPAPAAPAVFPASFVAWLQSQPAAPSSDR